jgi:hypothetical protein
MEASDRAHEPTSERAEQRDKLPIVLTMAIVAVYMTVGVALYVLVAALN